jgi:uncharacterized protein (TIGR03437 family)
VIRILTRLNLLGGCLLATALVYAQAPKFTIQDLGSLPNLPACTAIGISQSGNVVGYCLGQVGVNLVTNPVTHAFLYSKGVMMDLNAASQSTPIATAVNDSGAVAGAYLSVDLVNGTAGSTLFVYRDGLIQPQLPGPIQALLPFGLNNTGQLAGTNLQISAGSFNFFIGSKALLANLTGGTQLILSSPGGGSAAAFGLNSMGVVAGASVAQNATVVNPLLWQPNGTPQPLPLLAGYPQAVATSVNDSGVAAGVAFNINFAVLQDLTATAHAVVFSNGSVTDLGAYGSDRSSMALGINNSGWVVGFSSRQRPDFTLQLAPIVYAPGSNYRAFVDVSGKMYDLNTLLVNGTGWQLSYATAINNAGQIVGTGLFQDGSGNTFQRGFLLTPVPGPSITNIEGAGFSTPAVTSISPNGLFTIFGNALASESRGLTQSDIVNNQLPTNLGGSCVESGATKWGLFYVSPGQINALAGALPSSGTVPVSVITNCGTTNEVASTPLRVPVAAVAPEFLYFPQTSDVAAIQATTGAYVGPPGLISGASFAPAHPGDTLSAFGVGWGATTSSDQIGTVASAAASLSSFYALTLGGKPASVLYAGLSPGFAGLYQINFTVPAGLTSGNQALVLNVGGTLTSPKAFIAIGN